VAKVEFTHRDICSASKGGDVQRPKRTLPALSTHNVIAAMHLGEWLAGTSICLRSVSHLSSSLSAAATEVTTVPAIVVAVSGRKQMRLLQSKCKWRGAEMMASSRAYPRPKHPHKSHLLKRKDWALAATTSTEGAASSRLRLLLPHPPKRFSPNQRNSPAPHPSPAKPSIQTQPCVPAHTIVPAQRSPQSHPSPASQTNSPSETKPDLRPSPDQQGVRAQHSPARRATQAQADHQHSPAHL
jgi:hypothetical protein